MNRRRRSQGFRGSELAIPAAPATIELANGVRRSSEERGVRWCARLSRGSALFIESRRAVGAAVRSTPMRVLRRASKLDNGGILFRASWRSSGRRQRGRAVPNSVRWSRRVARQTRDVVVVSGGSGQGSVSRACPAHSRWHGEAAGEERGAREGAMRRGDSWPWRARRQTCDVAPMPLLSHQCVVGACWLGRCGPPFDPWRIRACSGDQGEAMGQGCWC